MGNPSLIIDTCCNALGMKKNQNRSVWHDVEQEHGSNCEVL